MDIQGVLNSIKNNDVASNYLLYGEEHFFIDQIDNSFIKHIIPDSEKIFNEKIFYGKETNIVSLLNTLKSFPMMGLRQLIIVREAQELEGINQLVHYLNQPIDSTILVVCYKTKKSSKKKKTIDKIDKRNKWIKSFQKNGLLIECKRVYPNKISYWIQLYLKEKNIQIEKKAEILLMEHLGNNLSKITNAINKLHDFINDSTITLASVQEHIGIHRDYNNFELQEALANKNNQKVISIINYFISNPKKFPPQPIIGTLFSFFSKLLIVHSLRGETDTVISEKINIHSFFINQYKIGCNHYSFEECINIISLLKEGDFRFKGIKGSSDSSFLKEMLIRILS